LRAAALLAAEGKRWPQAEEFFELAIKAQPKDRAELLLAWGLQLLIEGKHEEAAAVFQRGIDSRALPDDNPAFHFYLAGALAMQDKHDEALAAAQAAAEKRPGNPRFESRLAWILYHARRYDDARQAYQKLIEKYDNDYSSPEVREVLREARLALSNIEVQQENWLAAEEWLEQVLDEFPDDPSANNDLGYLWADRGVHLQRALRMTRLAVEAEPDNVAYLDSLGWALHRLGKHDEALPPLEKAAESDDPDGVILDHLGDVYQALGRHDDAHNAWKRALEAFHKAEENDKARAVRKKLNRSSRQP
jgi:tetratricopeptide (TPR) repeat protein